MHGSNWLSSLPVAVDRHGCLPPSLYHTHVSATLCQATGISRLLTDLAACILIIGQVERAIVGGS